MCVGVKKKKKKKKRSRGGELINHSHQRKLTLRNVFHLSTQKIPSAKKIKIVSLFEIRDKIDFGGETKQK
jgi:hypothetical protein